MPNAGPVAINAARELQRAWEYMSHPDQFQQHIAGIQRIIIDNIMDVGQREAAITEIEQRMKELEENLAEVIPNSYIHAYASNVIHV